MAKILTFRNKGGASSDHDFLADENQTLAFRTDKNGGISLGTFGSSGLPNLFPDPRKDWGNQELADLFRVRQLLSAANVPVETDRGVTDEGDPWFVFCHGNGEVFIHLCRIDGLYVLDSPNVLRPLRGADFADLISDFTNQALPARSTEEDTARRVIKLERGGKVRLHPSAMLAALIWTLFLASEELVLLAPEEPIAADDDALLDFGGLFAIETTETSVDALFLDQIDPSSPDLFAADGHTIAAQDTPDAQGQMRETLLQQQGLTAHNNAFTMGLSTIAIAMGFMSETVLLDNQRKVLQTLKELGFSDYRAEADAVAELDNALDEEGSALLAMLAEFLGLDLSLNTDLAEIIEQGDAARMQEDLAHLSEDVIDDDLALVGIRPAALQSRKKDVIEEIDPGHGQVVKPEIVIPVTGEDTLSADTGEDDAPLTLSQIVQAWQPRMEEMQMGQTTIKASFNLSDRDAFALFDLIGNSGTSNRTTSFEEFDDLAQRLIDFIESKEGDLAIIELANEIIMIDRTAITGGEIEYMNWETDDGKIISLVGLASDFQLFDMIA